MRKILSIIIPSYNMERYLSYCLDSLLVCKHRESFEALIVNDGSCDNTLAIAQKYAGDYPGVFRVIDKKNGNYGSCINAALPLAVGKYVKVLDADDSYDTTNLEYFLVYLEQVDADLILSDYEIVNENRAHKRTVCYNFQHKSVVSFPEICGETRFVDEIQMHAVTYRRSMLLKMNYRQTEGISYTDQQWIFTPMIKVENIAYFNKVVYRYLVGREGQTMDPKVKMRSMEHARKNSLGLISDYEMHKEEIRDSRVRSYLYSRLAWYIKDIYAFYILNYNRDNAIILREYDQTVMKMSREIYDMIGSKKVSSIRGFAYIDYWRKHKIPVFPVRLLGHMYKALFSN